MMLAAIVITLVLVSSGVNALPPRDNAPSLPDISGVAQNQSFSITQVPNPFYSDNLVDYKQQYTSSRLKFDPSFSLPEDLAKRQSTTTVTGIPTGNALWAFPISIGTPPQISHVILDTGSTGFWVFSTSTNTQAKNHAFYSPSISTTSHKIAGQKFVSNYASGSASGEIYQDKVQLGAILVNNFFVGSAINVTDWFETYNIDGTLGLDMDSLDTQSPTRQTSFLNLLSQNGITIFSVDFRLNVPGIITFGAIPSTFSRSITYLPSDPATFGQLWTITLSSISVASVRTSLSLPVILDTGTNYIALPDHLAAAYYSYVTSATNASGLWEYPCSSPLPDWGFGVAGATGGFNVAGALLRLTTMADGKTCVGVVQGGGGDTPVLGVPFFQATGVVFDFAQRRVGITTKV